MFWLVVRSRWCVGSMTKVQLFLWVAPLRSSLSMVKQKCCCAVWLLSFRVYVELHFSSSSPFAPLPLADGFADIGEAAGTGSTRASSPHSLTVEDQKALFKSVNMESQVAACALGVCWLCRVAAPAAAAPLFSDELCCAVYRFEWKCCCCAQCRW